MIRSACVTLVLVVLVASPAGGGEIWHECYHADLTADGRYVLLSPGCTLSRVFDLKTGAYLKRKEVKAFKGKAAIPLRVVPSTDKFGKWLSRSWEADAEGVMSYAWTAYELPGSPWLLRVLCKLSEDSYEATLIRAPQYAPRSVFKAAFEARKRKIVRPEGEPPTVTGLGSEPQDVTGVFTLGEKKVNKRRKRTNQAVTYNAKRFAELVPTFADFLRHGTWTWFYITSEGTSGFKFTSMAPKGFWSALGHEKANFRVVYFDEPGNTEPRSTRHELQRVYEALRAGKTVKFNTFRPYHWTIFTLTPH